MEKHIAPAAWGRLAAMEDLDSYRVLFTDAGFWAPYVRAVCARHGLAPCATLRTGLPGTCPTFIVDDRWVVKLFGRLFAGGQAWEVERAMARLLAGGEAALPAPALLAAGHLGPDGEAWPWPYLVYAYAPGVSAGQVYDQLSSAGRLGLARSMAAITRRLHALALARPSGNSADEGAWPAAWREPYSSFLARQRAGCAAAQRAWGTLPGHLLAEIDSFLPAGDDLLQPGAGLHPIHADLTGDHVLGRIDAGRWQTLAVIDFGDALPGDLYYELVALHLDLFRCDKEMLRAFLDVYAPPQSLLQDFARRAMACTLLHRFDVLSGVFGRWPAARRVGSLAELAALVWDLDAPGMDVFCA